MGVPIQSILVTVFQSIFQVFLLCVAGYALAFKGIVDKPTSKAINHINVALFTPALLFSKVAFFLTPAKLRQLWVIPIFFVVVTALSALIAYGLARACRLKRSQVNFATAASMFMNSNSLPVALMESLATTVPLLKWGPDDTFDAMFGRSLTYLVVFSTLGMILRWSYGVRLLSQADEPEPATPPPTAYRDDDTDQHPPLTHVTVDPSTASLVDYETEASFHTRDRHTRRTRAHRARHLRLTPVAPRHSHPHPHTHLHSHLPAVPTSLGDQSESDDSDEFDTTEDDSEDTIALRSDAIDTGFSTETEDRLPAPASEPTPRWDRHAPSLFLRLLNTLTSLSPPLVASLLALFCVLVPPVQQLLKSDGMIPFKGALDSAGGCSIPLTMLVLGGWFWDGEKKPSGVADTTNAKSKGKGVQKRHTTEHAPCPGHHTALHSLDSSTTSLSSMIGAFQDVFMARRRGAARASWHFEGTVDSSACDLEPGPQSLSTHTEIETEIAENGNRLERASRSRSRSQTDPVNGRARSSAMSAPSPTSHARGTDPPGETLTVFITLFARMVVVPAIVTPMMVLVSRLGWGGDVFEDPVFIVSSMLLISSPPALTLAQISQHVKPTAAAGAATNPDILSPFERLLSRTVFWAYLVLTPPITIASVMVGLLLIGA
ncbi:membrane transport protein-domain-containing protein [Boletus coccyginus]|nr:membrane transport protein-domain-containing protein [Boletus coccyginus]